VVGPIRTSRTTRAGLLAGLAVLLAFAPDALAQRRHSQEQRDREEARDWYTSGREALQNGEPEVALASFEQAYGLYPHWASMVGMGLAYQAMGQNEQALVCFQQGLDEGGAEMSLDEMNDVQTRIATLAALLPPPLPPVNSVPPPPPPDDGGSSADAWFWGLIATAGTLAVTAIATGSYTLVLDREYHDPATASARQDEIRPTGEALQVTTDVMLGLAGAAAIAAVVVFVVSDDDESTDQGGVAVTAAPAGTGLGVAVTF
jgi:tetratricopeptide (TPR) repeat protein